MSMVSKKLLSVVLASLSTFPIPMSAKKNYGYVGYSFGNKRYKKTLKKQNTNSKNKKKFKANPTNNDKKSKPYSRGKSVYNVSEKNIMRKIEKAGIKRSQVNVKKVVAILCSLGIPIGVAIVLAIKYCCGNSRSNNEPNVPEMSIWDADTEKIIKFIKWDYQANGGAGSCTNNSYLNMLLNPVFLEGLRSFLGKYKNDNANAILNIWDNYKNHEYISWEVQKKLSTTSLYPNLAKFAPEIFGTMTSVGEAKNNNCKTPPTIGCTVGAFPFKQLNKDNTSYKLNGSDYFVGGMVLYTSSTDINRKNGGHAVYAHFLYDDNNEVKRIIIQDPNSLSSEDKYQYVYEWSLEEYKKLLQGSNMGKGHLDIGNGEEIRIDYAMMIRKDKFEASNYWKNKSLPLEGFEVSKDLKDIFN